MEDINITQPQLEPWLQQEDEGSEAYSAFCIYRDLGPHRSLDQAYQQQMSSKRAPENTISNSPVESPPVSYAVSQKMRASGRWNAWNTTHEWPRRALAYDRRLASVEQESRESALAENAIDWVEERHLDMIERLETYRNLRSALKKLTRKAIVETRTKAASKNAEGYAISSEVRLLDQFRVLNDLRKSLFPPDAMDLDEWASQWRKFAPPEPTVTITRISALAPESLETNVETPAAPGETTQSTNA